MSITEKKMNWESRIKRLSKNYISVESCEVLNNANFHLVALWSEFIQIATN